MKHEIDVKMIHKRSRSRRKAKIARVTDEGWNSQKQLSGPVDGTEEERKEKKRLAVSSSKPLSRFSSL